MSIRPLVLHPDPRLRKTCEPVAAVDADVRRLMTDMLDTMYDAPGVGLAAPQVGVLRRVIVLDCAAQDATPEPMAMANPELVWTSEETNIHEEGCLSIPDFFGDVVRPKQVRVRYLDENGAMREVEADGLLATCLQHEIDHLNGKLFIDFLGPVRRQMITQRMKKRKRELLAARDGDKGASA